MLFTSLEFFALLPLVLLVFAALPIRQRWMWLLLASYVFYGIWQPFNLVYLGAVTLVIYACGGGMQSATARFWRVAFLAAGLVAVLGSLFAFKFYDFVAGEIERVTAQIVGGEPLLALPRIGISTPVGYSFYAFSAASYLIDIYMRRLPERPSAGHVALYVAYFPKILAGPIERGTTFLPQVWNGLRSDPDRLVLGLQLIGWGLFKKVVIADNLAPLVDRNFAIAAFAAPMELLISIYFFAFQIYCDFSGYTDIAIGISLLFGIQLMQNFRRPYLSRSTAEFWAQRWHISLGSWFRDYLYIPLGGNRAGTIRKYANSMIVFLVSGLWHAGLGYGVGWSFLVWGSAERLLSVDGVGHALVLAACRSVDAARQRSVACRGRARVPDVSSHCHRVGLLPRQVGRRCDADPAESRFAPWRDSSSRPQVPLHGRALLGLRPDRLADWQWRLSTNDARFSNVWPKHRSGCGGSSTTW